MSSNLIDRTMDWGIAKLVKASDSESDMRRFESYYPCQTLKSPMISGTLNCPHFARQIFNRSGVQAC